MMAADKDYRVLLIRKFIRNYLKLFEFNPRKMLYAFFYIKHVQHNL